MYVCLFFMHRTRWKFVARFKSPTISHGIVWHELISIMGHNWFHQFVFCCIFSTFNEYKIVNNSLPDLQSVPINSYPVCFTSPSPILIQSIEIIFLYLSLTNVEYIHITQYGQPHLKYKNQVISVPENYIFFDP